VIASRAELLVALGKASSISDADLALLNTIHPRAERAVKSYMQCDIEYAQKTEYLPIGRQAESDVNLEAFGMVNGRVVRESRRSRLDKLQLKHTPVITTDLAVYEDTGAYAGQASGAFAAATLLTSGTEYYLDLDDASLSRSGQLVRIGGTWSTEPRSIKVTYNGGWTATQLDAEAAPIKEAVVIAAARAYWGWKTNAATDGKGAMASESIGKYSVSYGGASAVAGSGLMVDVPEEAQRLLQPFRNYGRYLM
jgi:hypothetical protein